MKWCRSISAIRALKAHRSSRSRHFKRVHLKPGEKQTVNFELRDRDLSTVNAAGAHRIEAGDVKLWIGGGQPVGRAGLPKPAVIASQFTITDSAELPK